MNHSPHHSGFPFRYVFLLGTLVQAGVSLSCNDSLPPYSAPANVFRSYVRNISPAAVSYQYGFANGAVPSRLKSISPPQVFFIDIVNTFDEVLQDQPEVSGALEITDDDMPEVKATIPITVANLTGPQYNTTTNILTLLPRDTLRLRCSWGYKTDDSLWAFQRAYVVEYVSDNRGNTLVTHAPMNFSATARTKLFKSTNVITSLRKGFQLLFNGVI